MRIFRDREDDPGEDSLLFLFMESDFACLAEPGRLPDPMSVLLFLREAQRAAGQPVTVWELSPAQQDALENLELAESCDGTACDDEPFSWEY